MEITVNINAPELVEAMHALARSLSTMSLTYRNVPETSAPAPAPALASAPALAPAAAPTYTAEEVRAALAAISQAGHPEKVKAILASAGAKKLSEVPAEKYAVIMAQVAIVNGQGQEDPLG